MLMCAHNMPYYIVVVVARHVESPMWVAWHCGRSCVCGVLACVSVCFTPRCEENVQAASCCLSCCCALGKLSVQGD